MFKVRLSRDLGLFDFRLLQQYLPTTEGAPLQMLK